MSRESLSRPKQQWPTRWAFPSTSFASTTSCPMRQRNASTEWRASSADSRSKPSAQTRRSEEHTSELQSREKIVCRLLLEKKKVKDASRLLQPRYKDLIRVL